MTFLFRQQLTTKPDDIAINDFQHQRTWKELASQVHGMAHWFAAQGLQPGDHIALLIGNRTEFIEAMLGGIFAGLWVTPVNTHLVAEEAHYICKDSGAKILLFDDDLESLVTPDPQYVHQSVQDISSQLLASEQEAEIAPSAAAGGTMLYTSGTTGRPKGVKRSKPETLGEAIEKMQAGATSFGLTGTGPHLVTGPLYHAAPMLFALYDMLNGAPMIIMPKWDNELFLDTVEKFHVTTSHLVPTMFVRLLNDREKEDYRERDLSSLKLVLHGAAPIAVTTKQQMIDWWGPILVEYWGASEAGTTTLVTSAEWLAHPGTVGKPLPHFKVYIGDENGNPSGKEEGQLFARHDSLAQVFEYHNDPDKTARAHPQPHVFCIGDIGRVDEEGFVYLSDRESNMIISGGVNIYPAEVEQAMLEHPAIADLGVFGIPNPEWGEEVKAAIQLKEGIAPSKELAEDILEFTRGKIARFKVPRSIDFHEELPRTPTGKLLIRKLKQAHTNN